MSDAPAEYDDGSGVVWANGAKRARFYVFPAVVVLPCLAWLLVPPFSTLHWILWFAAIMYLDYKRNTFRDFITSAKLDLIGGKMRITNQREVDRRNLAAERWFQRRKKSSVETAVLPDEDTP